MSLVSSLFHTEMPHYRHSGGCQFSTVVCSHRTEHLWCKLCKSHSKLALLIQKLFPCCLPVNLNMSLVTVHSHMDVVIMCCDWDPDPPNILESDKGKFFFLNDIITSSPSVKWMLSDSHLRGESWGKVQWSCSDFFQDINYSNKIVEGDKNMVS